MTWIVTGAGGQLGSVLLHALVSSGRQALGLVSATGPRPTFGTCRPVDLEEPGALNDVRLTPNSILIHAAAVASLAVARADPERARRVNAVAAGYMAERAADAGARFVYVSTDMVFDGESAPYGENASPRPVSSYGRTKLEGELSARAHAASLVVRLPLLYGLPKVERATTFSTQMRDLLAGRSLGLYHDEYRTPLHLDDAAKCIIAVAETKVSGLLHIGGPERLSRLEMGYELARALKVATPNIESRSRLDVESLEPRPFDLSLDSRAYERVMGEPAGRPMRVALRDLTL